MHNKTPRKSSFANFRIAIRNSRGLLPALRSRISRAALLEGGNLRLARLVQLLELMAAAKRKLNTTYCSKEQNQ